MLNILQITYIMYLLWTLSYIQTICMLFNHYCLKKYVVVCPPSRLLSYIFIVVMMDQACEYDEPFPKSTCSTCSLSQCEQMLDWKGEKIEKIITVVVGCRPRWSDFPDPTKEHLIENKGIFAKSDLEKYKSNCDVTVAKNCDSDSVLTLCCWSFYKMGSSWCYSEDLCT